jgi:hypothetical protein
VLVTFSLLGFPGLGGSSGKVSGSVHSINVGGDPFFSTYDTRNGDVYVVNGASNNVTVIHGMSVVVSVNAGSDPRFATYDGGNGYVYVSSFDTGNISVLSPQSGAAMQLGLPSTEGHGLLAGVGAAIVTGTVVFVVLKRWGKNTRDSESSPSEPGRDELTSPRG